VCEGELSECVGGVVCMIFVFGCGFVIVLDFDESIVDEVIIV